MAIAKGKDAKLWFNADAGTMEAVANAGAQSAASDPNHSYLKDTGKMYTSASSAWVEDTRSHDAVTWTLTSNYDTFDKTTTETGSGTEVDTTRREEQLTINRPILKTNVAISGKNVGVTFNSVDYSTLDASYERTYQEINQTNSGTGAGLKDFTYNRYTASGSFTIDIEVGTALPVTGSAQAGIIEFDGADVKINGSMILTASTVDGDTNEKAGVASFDYVIDGDVTETGIDAEFEVEGTGLLRLANAHGYIFSGIIKMAHTLTANVEGETTQSETFRINNGYTEFIT